jgi:hypothetical protein
MASNQTKRRRHRRSFGAIRQLKSGNFQASYKDLNGVIQLAPQTYPTREAAALQSEQTSSVGSVGAIPVIAYQFTTRSLQQHFNKSSWLAHSDQPAMRVRGIMQELAHKNWVRPVVTEPTDKGGRPAELWELHPQASDYLKSFYG